MSAFKADPMYSEGCDDSDESDVDETLAELAGRISTRHDPEHSRRVWRDDNYDVLTELYRIFCANGERAFGLAFFQFGSFAQFVEFVYELTYIPNKVLLKPKGGAHNVGTVVDLPRRECWVHGHEEAKGA